MGRTQQYVRLGQFENLERVNAAIIEKLDTQETQIKTLTDEIATLKALFEEFRKVPGDDEATQCFNDDVANLDDFADTEALKHALRPDLECVIVYPSTFDLSYYCSAEDPDMIVWQWSMDTRDFVKVGTFNNETEDESDNVIWLDGCDPRPIAEGVPPVAYDNQVDIQADKDVDEILHQIVAQVDEETKEEKKEKKKVKKDKPKKEKDYPPEVAKARADYESLYEKKARSNASLATLLKKIAEKDNGEGVGF